MKYSCYEDNSAGQYKSSTLATKVGYSPVFSNVFFLILQIFIELKQCT